MVEMDFTIRTLGESRFGSPIELSSLQGDYLANYVRDDEFVLHDIFAGPEGSTAKSAPSALLEKAGPRQKVYFDPAGVHAAIVTCGGLCPGLNGVIRAIVMCLWHRYGVKHISGIRYGYRGFLKDFGLKPVELGPELVRDIHRRGGTILGSSRGYGDRTVEIVDTLEKMGVNMLFSIGGDGTQQGALHIAEQIRQRNAKIAVVGIPKTIDNDLSFVQRSFGFDTAVSKAVEAVYGAHVEAYDAPRGVGIVKVMGRQAGFIAAHTALAINDVNFVLVPEVPFDLDGDNGLLRHLEQRLDRRDHAVILVAEGAGQDLLAETAETDASGNIKLGDIGIFLKDRINAHFKAIGQEVNVKYIDPSYIIRSMPANPNDSVYCVRLGANAVHAAMTGRTEMLVSLLHDEFVHVPIRMAVAERNCINPDGALWRDVIEATGQCRLMKN